MTRARTRASFDTEALAETLAASMKPEHGSASIAWGATVRPSPQIQWTIEPTDTLPIVDVRAVEASGATADLELVRILGEGGMGAVWLANQRSLRREVAIKMPRDLELGSEALIWEARLAGSLEHPSVVPTYALGRDDAGKPVLVMKRVEGVTLGELLERQDHPRWAALLKRSGDRLGVIVEVLLRVTDALEFAHARGIIHRDVKPDNVMIGSFGEVYLLDWGVALERGNTNAHVVGTPAFLAPEMLEGVADERTDVFLLGATLHVALTGTPRHAGSSLAAVLRSASECAPVRYDDAVAADLARLCNDATACEPDARPQSALAFRERLAEFQRHRALDELVLDIEARVLDPARASDRTALLEARFALASVVREAPSFSSAKDLHQRVLAELVRVEVEAGRAREAQVVLSEIAAPSPELTLLVERAHERERAAEEAARFGAAEQREVAVAPTYRGMVFFVAAMAVVAAVMLGAIHFTGTMTMWRIFVIDLVGVAVIGAATLARRRSILANRRGRATVVGTFFYFACVTFTDLFSALHGIPVETASAFSLLAAAFGVSGCVLIIPGISSRMRVSLAGAAINALVLGFVAIALPSIAATLVGFATLVTLGVALFWLRDMSRDLAKVDADVERATR